jgi:flavodoxin
MAKALIVWSSRTGNTTKIAGHIAEGFRDAGWEADVRDVKYVEDESEVAGHDALILGSSTYHGEMNRPMKDFLFMAEKIDLENVLGGAFGAFEFSSDATDRIFDTMKHVLKMKMATGPLHLKSAAREDGIEKARAYGRGIAGLIRQKAE